MSIIYEPKGRALEYSLLAVNHYTGCGHGCYYCYAKQMAVQFGQPFDKPAPRKNVLEQLRKEAPLHAGTDKRVLLCFMCDPYQPIDIEHGITRDVIHILREYNIPFQVLTKGGMQAARDFDLYGKNDAFATTLTYLSLAQSLDDEPGASSPASRIEAIKQAHSRGIDTWVSLEPVLDAEESLEIIRQTCEFVNLYKIGKMNHCASVIDWRAFGISALELCRQYNKKYYIKNDLAEYLEGVPFVNTDTRKVIENNI